jgi:hypothetical protein
MSPSSPHTPVADAAARRRLTVVLAFAAVIIAAAATAGHLTAVSAYDRTADGGTVQERLASAQLASRLEPWNARFEWRVIALQGLQLLQEGRVDSAFWLLEPYSLIVRGDPVYRSIYQQVVAIKAPLDSRKAHVQHAREQTGGVLLEKDVQH